MNLKIKYYPLKEEELETQIKKRIDWLDIAKGIAIICTIIGHSVEKNKIGVFIFSFHMPLFFILSGYTLKKIQFSELPKATLKDFLRLILPVFAVLAIDFILQTLFFDKNPISLMKSYIKRLIWGNMRSRSWETVVFSRFVLVKTFLQNCSQ